MNREHRSHFQVSHRLAAPLVGTGVLMALYLVLRPYGDTGGPAEQIAAFTSPWWVVSHVCGMLALASIARLALRAHDLDPRPLTAIARWSGLAGAVLVLPYYGAEAFSLREIALRAESGDVSLLGLVDEVRAQPVATTMFGLGLLLLAVAGLLIARWWADHAALGAARLAAWPLGVLIAAVLPQFYLPEGGRIAFGVAYLGAALLFWISTSARPVGAGTRDRERLVELER